MKRILVFLLALMLALPVFAESDVQLVVVNRVEDKTAYSDFAFAEDADLLEVVFPQMLDCDAILLRCGGETILVDSCKKAFSERIVNMCKQLGITRIDRCTTPTPMRITSAASGM